MREPAFWWEWPGNAAKLLAPIAAVYGCVAQARLGAHGSRAEVPVVCIGNLTIGGAGKTPTALAAAQLLMTAGERPFFLTRGYGGRASVPLQVDLAKHGAREVGDEAILLAKVAPTIVSRARAAGAEMAVAGGASVIVMDDGFQNPTLEKDFSVLVIDRRRGIGNGYVVPAGPLRAPLAAQLKRAHALVLIGKGTGETPLVGRFQSQGLPVFEADLMPDAAVHSALTGERVLAFAGIGDPQKFFGMLSELGINVVLSKSFPDHHPYSCAETQALIDKADEEGLVLVTTEKDLARLAGEAENAELAARAQALPITLRWNEEERFNRLLVERLKVARHTRHHR